MRQRSCAQGAHVLTCTPWTQAQFVGYIGWITSHASIYMLELIIELHYHERGVSWVHVRVHFSHILCASTFTIRLVQDVFLKSNECYAVWWYMYIVGCHAGRDNIAYRLPHAQTQFHFIGYKTYRTARLVEI